MIRNLLCLFALLGAGSAVAQQTINCAPGVPCNAVSGPTNTHTGDQPWQAGGKINANFTDLHAFLYAPISGPVTIASGTNTSAIGANVLTNAMHAFMPAQTTKCNPLSIAGAPQDCPISVMNSMLGTGGGGSGLTSVGLTAPGIFTVTNSPLTANGTIALGFASGLTANQALMTPNGLTGSPGLRSIVWADLPNLLGPVTSSAGVTTIQSLSLTNAMHANMAAHTIACNATGSAAPPTDCPTGTINTMLGASTGDPQESELCTQSGVDATGATDSRAALVTAFAAVAGSNVVLKVNCPVKITIGTDYTKALFVQSGTNLSFGPNGYFIVDNVGTGVFVFESVHDITWLNTKVLYQGNFGIAGGINSAVAPLLNVPNNLNAQITSYLSALYTSSGGTQGNSFTGGATAIWPGVFNRCAIFQIDGQSYRINFIGGNSRIWVADNATAGQYAPALFALGNAWNPGLAVSSGTTMTTANTSVPSVRFNGWDFDGFYMGIVGAGNLIYTNSTAHRYSDIQDGTSGTVLFSGALSSGATSGTLASSWSYPTGIYALTFALTGATTTATSGTGSTATITFGGSATIPVGANVTISGVTPLGYDGTWTVTASSAGSVSFASSTTGSQTVAGTVGQIAYITMTNGSSTTGTFSQALGGGASATAASGNVGGISNWSPPPHNVYVLSGSSPNYLSSIQVANIIDYGQYNGMTARRTTTSGSALSLKTELANGTVIDNYITMRPDGCADLGNDSGNSSGGILRNSVCMYSSQTLGSNGGADWGIRFPSTNPYSGTVLQNVTFVDTAAAPTSFPIVGNNLAGNTDMSLTGIKIYQNDIPTATSFIPSMGMGGNNFNLELEYHLAQMSTTTQFIGVVEYQGTTYCSNCNYDVKVFGWRQLPVVFTGSLSSGATGGTLAATWPYSSGTYSVNFSDGETRYVTFTNGSTTVGAWTALTSGATATAAGGNALVNNLSGYRNRMLLNFAGGSLNSRAHLLDVSNGYEAFVDNGSLTEYFSQIWSGTPTGTTFATPIVFPSTFAIDRQSYIVNSNLDATNGLTTIGVGWTGTPTALYSAQGITTAANPVLPMGSPVSLAGSARTILLTPTAGTFGTTGHMTIGFRGAQMSAAQ